MTSITSLTNGLRQLRRRNQHGYIMLPWRGAALMAALFPPLLIAASTPASGPLQLQPAESLDTIQQSAIAWGIALMAGAVASLLLRGVLTRRVTRLCRANLATGIFDDHLMMLIPERRPEDRSPEPAHIYKRLTELLRDYDEICWRRGLKMYPRLNQLVEAHSRTLVALLLLVVIGAAVGSVMRGWPFDYLYFTLLAAVLAVVPLASLVHASTVIGATRAMVEHTMELHGLEPATPAASSVAPGPTSP